MEWSSLGSIFTLPVAPDCCCCCPSSNISALSGSILLRLVVMSSQSRLSASDENLSANPIRRPRPPSSTVSSKNSSICEALSRRAFRADSINPIISSPSGWLPTMAVGMLAAAAATELTGIGPDCWCWWCGCNWCCCCWGQSNLLRR